MKSLSKTILATGAAVVSLAAVSSQASAALVTAWDWSVTTGFTGVTWEDRGPGSGNPANGITNAGTSTGAVGVYQDALTTSWGGDGNFAIGGNRSALTLNDGFAGGGTASSPPQALTDGVPVGPTSSVTHWNNPVRNELDFLKSATMTSTLNLTPAVPAGPGFALPSLVFTVDFKETNNGGSCAVPPGAGGPCPDIFVIAPGAPFSQQFSLGQYTYEVEILALAGPGLSSIVDLSDAACAAAGALSGCKGFTTEENAATKVEFGFQISQVPEPGTLSLVGLGLVGGAVLRRRKKVA